MLMLLYIPLGFLLYNIDVIMGESFFNADPGSLSYAITYTRTIMIGFFFEALYDLEKKYLLQFGNALFPMLIQFVTLPLHILFVSILYNRFGNSLTGIAIATCISFFLNFIILHLYLTFFTREQYRFRILPRKWDDRQQKEFKSTLKEYVRLGIPSVLMTYFDFWIYTVLLFVSSYLGVLGNAA